jgi:hypothetical protein
MVGSWSQHVAFLDDRRLKRRSARDSSRSEIGRHPATGIIALGNEIPPGVVRWHGRVRIERFLRELYEDAKAAAPDNLFTYVNFPPTEFLDLSFFDLYAFNVYLHRETELRGYLTRLQHIAGHKPLLLAEAGADSIREGEAGQAEITAMHIRTAFEEGACGAIAFAWTTNGGAAALTSTTGRLACRSPPPARGGTAVATRSRTPFTRARGMPRALVVVRLHAAAVPETAPAARAADLPALRDHSRHHGLRDRTAEIAATPACA